MTNALAIRQKTEDAIRAYLASQVVDDSPLDKLRDNDDVLPIYTAHSGTDFVLPCFVIECPKAMEVSPGTGWYNVDTYIHCFGAMDEIIPDADLPGYEPRAETAETLHPARVSQLAGLMNWLEDGALQPLNKPPVTDPITPDLREVKDFCCFGVAHAEETGDQEESHFFDLLKYEVHCMPYDGS